MRLDAADVADAPFSFDKRNRSRSHGVGSMKTLFLLTMLLLPFCSASAAQGETRFFELRTYHAAPGKLDDLVARFRNHTTALFEKHGIANIGYWLPETNSENTLIYLLAYPSREAREKSWKEFFADPEWQSVAKQSESNGRLVTKVDSVYLQRTDFSPPVAPARAGTTRLYELRRYHASPGKLDELLARFRDHTMALFTRHGMGQLGYWVPTESKDGAGETLIYILIHKDRQAWADSFKAFRSDPEWVKVKSDSEKNGSLTVEGGVKSVLMTPTDFSPAN